MKEKDYEAIVSILCEDYDYSVISENTDVVNLSPGHYYVGSGALELIIKHGLSCTVRFNFKDELVLSIDKH